MYRCFKSLVARGLKQVAVALFAPVVAFGQVSPAFDSTRYPVWFQFGSQTEPTGGAASDEWQGLDESLLPPEMTAKKYFQRYWRDFCCGCLCRLTRTNPIANESPGYFPRCSCC